MSKIIAEIENPKGCDDCPLMDATPAGDYDDSEWICLAANRDVNPATVCRNEKPAWCPLHPAPDYMASWVPCSVRQPTESGFYIATAIFTGWNMPDPTTERIWWSTVAGGWSFPGDSVNTLAENYAVEVVAWMEFPEPYNPNGIYNKRKG